MDRIASPQGLQAELRRLLDYSQSPKPSREKLASDLRELAERVAAYGYETLPASEVDVGDYLVERDGAALEVEDVQKSGSYIVFTLKPYGMTRIAPQKVRATTKVRVQKKSQG